MKTGSVAYGSVVDIDEHDNGPGHPERPARLVAVEKGLELGDLSDALVALPRRIATRAELERVHDPAYLDIFEAFNEQGGGAFDQETFASAGSWDTAVASAGMGLAERFAARG